MKKEKIKSTCHPELVSGSIENNALNIAGSRNKFGMTECGEDGRSMVEMLGVLAIIGVLSIGGVYGYTTAMNKHRANELLHQVSMRATSCAAQIAMGNTPSVADFGDNKYGVTNTDLTNQFAITVDGVDTDVCQNMMNTIGDSTQVRYMALKGTPQTKITACVDGTTDYAFVYNNDLSLMDTIPTKPCSGQGWAATDGSCNCRPGYNGDQCQTASCPVGQMYCGLDDSTPICCESGAVCTTAGDKVSGTCFKDTTGTGCTTNDDCKTAEKCSAGVGKCYCQLSGSSSGSGENCVSTITSGSCQPIGESDSTTVTGIGMVVKSDDTMSWWSARNWCESQGMQLLDISNNRLGCGNPDIGTSAIGPCCDSGTDCGNDKSLQSQAMQDLRDKWGEGIAVWTVVDSPFSHCTAFFVNFTSGRVGSLNRRISKYITYNNFALCE